MHSGGIEAAASMKLVYQSRALRWFQGLEHLMFNVIPPSVVARKKLSQHTYSIYGFVYTLVRDLGRGQKQ
jgi:hypothetical protein